LVLRLRIAAMLRERPGVTGIPVLALRPRVVFTTPEGNRDPREWRIRRVDLMLGGASGAPTEGGGVKVATIHRTKRLHWPRVYLVGAEEGWLPHWHAKTDEQISEERKLCFVAVCRAEDELLISRIRSYKGYPQPPSRFLREMGA
jgi:superfamily I DNA/RNA helicase